MESEATRCVGARQARQASKFGGTRIIQRLDYLYLYYKLQYHMYHMYHMSSTEYDVILTYGGDW